MLKSLPERRGSIGDEQAALGKRPVLCRHGAVPAYLAFYKSGKTVRMLLTYVRTYIIVLGKMGRCVVIVWAAFGYFRHAS